MAGLKKKTALVVKHQLQQFLITQLAMLCHKDVPAQPSYWWVLTDREKFMGAGKYGISVQVHCAHS